MSVSVPSDVSAFSSGASIRVTKRLFCLTNATWRPSGLNVASAFAPEERVRRVARSAAISYTYRSSAIVSRKASRLALKFEGRRRAAVRASADGAPALVSADSSCVWVNQGRLVPVAASTRSHDAPDDSAAGHR